MKIEIEVLSKESFHNSSLVSFLEEEHIPDLEIKEKYLEPGESDMGFITSNIIELGVVSAPVIAVLLGILNCVKAYIEVNPKDRVKISFKGIELEVSTRNSKNIDKLLKKLLKIIQQNE
jgi:hypothetical protein